jgi:hypothetical protein
MSAALLCATSPTLETSVRVVLRPWNTFYPELKAQLKAANLDLDGNSWDVVFDFSQGEELDGSKQHFLLDESPQPPWQLPARPPPHAAEVREVDPPCSRGSLL